MNSLSHLTVLRGILTDPLMRAFAESDRQTFLSLLYECGAEENFTAYLENAVLTDENPFSKLCASGKTPSSYLTEAFIADLKELKSALDAATPIGYAKGSGNAMFGNWDAETADTLSRYYASNGFGRYLFHKAFRFECGEPVPIAFPSAIALSDLKGYEREKEEIENNLESFTAGLPFSDMLLYGDRGTGKSSTVHAFVNRYFSRKLRLVEISKEEIPSLPRLKTKLASVPMFFIIFIDDFSLAETDERISLLKASLQGSMEGHVENVMIVATSNRRHIVDERFDSRRDSVHRNDNEQELLSLSDRFGLTVLFSPTNKESYLSIVRELAADAQLRLQEEELFFLAERWALIKGGRSPRKARQFIDFASSREKRGLKIEF